jgi:hypothetical protein
VETYSFQLTTGVRCFKQVINTFHRSWAQPIFSHQRLMATFLDPSIRQESKEVKKKAAHASLQNK